MQGMLSIDFQLPGVKPENDENPEDALERLLTSRFRALKESICIETHETSITQRYSSSYSMDTKYIRLIFHATISIADVKVDNKVFFETKWADCPVFAMSH